MTPPPTSEEVHNNPVATDFVFLFLFILGSFIYIFPLIAFVAGYIFSFFFTSDLFLVILLHILPFSVWRGKEIGSSTV